MKRSLLLGLAGVVVALGVRRGTSACGFDFERMIERMPENAPPKWMFRNISAIRDNSERILQLLLESQEHVAPVAEARWNGRVTTPAPTR